MPSVDPIEVSALPRSLPDWVSVSLGFAPRPVVSVVMPKLCERPGCSESAAVVYRFDAIARQVWLELPSADLRSAGVLCARHADSMLVPLGWTLDDRRESVPRLFVLPARDRAPSAQRPARKSAALRAAAGEVEDDDGEQLTIDQAATVASITDREGRRADDTRALPWVPYDDTSDLEGVLNPHGELLARAFRGTERKRP